MGIINLRSLLILMVFLSGCAESPSVDTSRSRIIPPQNKAQSLKPPLPTGAIPRVFLVKKGDTLNAIGLKYGISYQLLSKWNNIPQPYLLQVGQLVKLYDPGIASNGQAESPKAEIVTVAPNVQVSDAKKTAPTLSNQQSAAPTKLSSAIPAVNAPVKQDAPISKKTATSVAKETSDVSKVKEKVLKLPWKWPIQGKLLKTFVHSGNKGIDIEGKVGEAVYAAADGKVVYSGNGLIGYGNLLIVKHDDVYLSAYANNASLQVKEGQKVTQGQVIARCGKSVTGIPSVHFEIRKNGKSVNPLLYLPTQ